MFKHVSIVIAGCVLAAGGMHLFLEARSRGARVDQGPTTSAATGTTAPSPATTASTRTPDTDRRDADAATGRDAIRAALFAEHRTLAEERTDLLATLAQTGVKDAPWMDGANAALQRRRSFAQLSSSVTIQRQGCYAEGCYAEVKASAADYQLLTTVMNTDPSTAWTGPSIATAPDPVDDQHVVGLWILLRPDEQSATKPTN